MASGSRARDQSQNHDELQVTSLKPGEWFPTHIVHLGFEGFAMSPTWSPDGHLLAIIHEENNDGNDNCWISIFSGSPPYQKLDHVAELSSFQFVNHRDGICTLDALSWSPDGEWLTVESGGLSLLSIRDILRDLPSKSDAPPTVGVPSSAFIPLTDPQDESSFAPSWNPRSHLISYLTRPRSHDQGEVWEPQRILTYDPTSQQRAVLLTLPFAPDKNGPASSLEELQHLSALAWTPDGQQILFVVDRAVGCVDCPVTYPSQVYTFTPTPISG
jgi:Tol biopolymer transport system component